MLVVVFRNWPEEQLRMQADPFQSLPSPQKMQMFMAELLLPTGQKFTQVPLASNG